MPAGRAGVRGGRTAAVNAVLPGAVIGYRAALDISSLADATNIETVYHLCAYLPLIGLLTAFLPTIRKG